MMKLASYVHVHDENGISHVLGPDDEVPHWAVGRITNPRAWEGGKVPDRPKVGEAISLAEVLGVPNKAPAEGEPDGGEQAAKPQQPPVSGSGSGVGAWTEHAKALGVEVPEGASRSEIQALLAERGLYKPE